MAQTDTRDGLGQRTDEQVGQFSRVLEAGGSLTDAKLAAGYSPHIAKMGKHGLPATLRTIAESWERARQFMELGSKVDQTSVSNLIKGRLTDAIANAEDSVAVQAAHRLGTHKDYNLFASDTQIGVAVYQVSPRLEQLAAQLAKDEPPILDATPSDTPSDVTK